MQGTRIVTVVRCLEKVLSFPSTEHRDVEQENEHDRPGEGMGGPRRSDLTTNEVGDAPAEPISGAKHT